MSTPAPLGDDLQRPTAADAYGPIRPVIAMCGVMWATEIVDIPLDGRLDEFGIRPRQLNGLDGIVFAPFLHGGFGHLIANTLPFLVLGAVIALGSVRRFAKVTVIVALISGLGVWLTGPENTIHIGASGLVFGYLLYLMSRGFFARKISYLLGGLLVTMIYGGILWGLLPTPGISWQGHLFGAIGGVAAAWILHAQRDEAPDNSGGPATARPT